MRTYRRALIGLTAFALAALFVATPFALREVRAQSASATRPGDAQLLALVDGLSRRVATLRGLSVERPIDRGVLDRAAILARLRARVAHEYPPGEVALEGEMVRRLGMIPESMDYERTMFDLLEEQVAGFYDPDDRRLFIAAWVQPELQVPTMAHEIVHALQDQHFGLSRFTHFVRGGGDRQTAGMAVVEGDATLAMLEMVLQSTGQSARSLRDPDAIFRSQLMDVSQQPRLGAAPRALRDSLLFPYRYGFDLCTLQYAARGFAAVDALLRDPPASTEQVLHADKLAAREPPIEIPPTTPPALASDHVLVSDDVLGELSLRLYLESGVDDATAEAAAAGWGGDRAMLFVPRSTGVVVGSADAGVTLPPGSLSQSVLIWKLVFDPGTHGDGDSEAREFEAAAVRQIAHRYAHGTVRTVPGVTRAIETAPGRTSAVARRGREVLVMDRVPSDRLRDVVREMLAGGRD
jgi:hypothetical protein